MKKSDYVQFTQAKFRKIILMMKVTAFLLFSFLVSVNASVLDSYSQATRLTLNLQNVKIKDVLDKIEESTEFVFIYYDGIIDVNQKVSLDVQNQTLENILNELFKSTDNTYKIVERQVVISKQSEIPGINVLSDIEAQQQQQKTVSGTVIRADNTPLTGVTVQVKGTTIGIYTGIDGSFSLPNVPANADTLIFSFIGYKTLQVPMMGQTLFNVVMNEEVLSLEEIVVVGYGVQKKESVVGAISQTKGEIIRSNIQGGDLGSSLIGSVPGLTTFRTTGRPGGMDYGGSLDVPVEMYVRGVKTWNNAAPLILVDGVERLMYNINPYDIEQISILKDASATAVFGVKGANGVILITTKRGQEGKAKLTFDYTTTVKTLSRIAKKSNAYVANNTKNWAILNEVPVDESAWSRIKPGDWVEYYKTHEYPEYFPDINWVDETLKDYTIDHMLNMTLTGGSKFVKYHTAISYLYESDLLRTGEVGQGYNPSFQFNRINLRSNLDFQITPTTTFSTNLSGSFYTQRKPAATMYGYKGYWGMAPDVWPIQYRDGVYGENPAVVNAEPVPWFFNYSGYELFKGVEVNTDFMLNQKLDFVVKGLSARAKLSYDNTSRTEGGNVGGALPMTKYIDPSIVDDPEFRPDMTDPELAELEYKYTTWNVSTSSSGYDWTMPENSWGTESVDLNVFRNIFYEFSLNYNHNFAKHEITGMALMSRQIRATGSQFPNYREDWVGRATYAYDRRYLFEVNAAYNGSEKFARKYRFGFFPSMAVGWVISNEEFFKPVKGYVNSLKLRYSDGNVGSDAGIDRWLYTSSYIVHPEGSGGENVFYFGYPYAQPSYPMRYRGMIPNEDIQWETSHKIDFGIEASFFDDMIKINFDYFSEKRSNVFVGSSDRAIPDFFGAPAVSANLGKVDLHGWELEGEFRKMFDNGITVWLTHSWAFAKDKIILKADPELKPAYQKAAGYQINQPRVTLNQGPTSVMDNWNDVYLTVGGENNASVLPGDFMRVDFNCDGVINADDNAPYGFPQRPQFTYAPSAGISYKHLSANVRFYGVYNIEGSVLYEQQSFAQNQSGGEAVVVDDFLSRAWSPEYGITGNNATFTGIRYRTGASGGYFAISRSYLRMESAEIAYSLDSKTYPWLKKLNLSNLRIKLSGNNLLLFSKMLNDKDIEGGGSNQIFNYPVLKRFNLGVTLDF